jgi:hypothetical protein
MSPNMFSVGSRSNSQGLADEVERHGIDVVGVMRARRECAAATSAKTLSRMPGDGA